MGQFFDGSLGFFDLSEGVVRVQRGEEFEAFVQGIDGSGGFVHSGQVSGVLNFSLVSLVNHVLLSFSDESFSVGNRFLKLSFLGSQDVGQSLLGIGDVSFSFVDQRGQSSDFSVVFVGSGVEGLVGSGVFSFQISQNFFNSGD